MAKKHNINVNFCDLECPDIPIKDLILDILSPRSNENVFVFGEFLSKCKYIDQGDEFYFSFLKTRDITPVIFNEEGEDEEIELETGKHFSETLYGRIADNVMGVITCQFIPSPSIFLVYLQKMYQRKYGNKVNAPLINYTYRFRNDVYQQIRTGDLREFIVNLNIDGLDPNDISDDNELHQYFKDAIANGFSSEALRVTLGLKSDSFPRRTKNAIINSCQRLYENLSGKAKVHNGTKLEELNLRQQRLQYKEKIEGSIHGQQQRILTDAFRWLNDRAE